jgi:hypothetical protein
MPDTLLALIAAHLIADFPLQSDWLLARKKNPLFLLFHISIVAVVTIAVLGAAPPLLMVGLVGTHLVMDAIKVYALKDTLKNFFLDQAFHTGAILWLAWLFPQAFASSLWMHLPPDILQAYQVGLCLAGGTILSLQTGAIIIRKATQPFLEQIGQDIEGLRHGGAYIGVLERALVMLLVLINQPAGVGFLITAKSILRFGDVKESHQRKLTEYVIIGTFLSFGWGLLAATITQFALKHWMP